MGRPGETSAGCVQVVGGVRKSLVVCGSRWWSVEVVGGVYKLQVVCGSLGWCVKVLGGVWKS